MKDGERVKKICFNEAWEFCLENHIDELTTFGLDKYSDAAGAAARFYDHSNWARIDLPHDWAVALPKRTEADPFAGAFPDTHYHRYMTERRSQAPVIDHAGWYRKQFTPEPEWAGKRVWIEFEGVFRDAVIWCNGVYLDRHASGYTSFAVELTDHLVLGVENSVTVRADADQPEGWWYEGAGIYRNVHLLIGEPVCFKYHQTVIRAGWDGTVQVSSVLQNATDRAVTQPVVWRILDAESAEAVRVKTEVTVPAYGEAKAEAAMRITAPKLWDLEDPYLYTLEVTAGGEQERTAFGVRTMAFDPDRGFLLNGKALKIRGACVHQDFGGVGVALSDNLQAYKIRKLKEMGVNAYRTHHAMAPALLDACDRLGMLVMGETRMFGTSPEAQRQLTDLIERDRNHPCVMIWSLGNEEFSVQNEARSCRLMQQMKRLASRLDPTRPVTYAGNNGGNDVGANAAADVRGINYIRNGENSGWIDAYHLAHPGQPVLGTEEGSHVQSRGGRENDLGNGLIDGSGTVTMPWGSTPKGWVKFVEARPWFAGSFLWTGFDYRGEPNPFYYTNVVSSFGAIDLCGMEKPPFYYYQAWWTERPVLKLLPHWNARPGETAEVWVFTNCDEITLYLNGKAVERRRVARYDAPRFTLPFAPGVLSVEGRSGGAVLRDELVTAGETADVRVTLALEAKTPADVAIYQLEARDRNGVFCPLAAEEAEVSVTGGRIIGVGNGDPSCLEAEQLPAGEEARYLRSFSDGKGVFTVPAKAPNAMRRRYDWLEEEPPAEGYEDEGRVVAKFARHLAPPQRQEYTARFTGAAGFEYIEFQRLGSLTEVYLNGEKIGDNLRTHGRQASNAIRPYRFECRFAAGENELRVVSMRYEEDPPAMSGYVKLGRRVEPRWKVRLHFGKARVFVKTDEPDAVKLHVKLALAFSGNT